MKGIVLAVALVLVATPVLAQTATGNGAISGGHYNLNIIGVEKGKTPPMNKSERHTIFVALGTKGAADAVTTRIYLTPGPDFKVCDGNGFDAAYDCSVPPNVIGRENIGGAVFMLPCNTNLDNMADLDHDGVPEPVEVIPCDPALGQNVAYYGVWARALGAHGGQATMTTCAYDQEAVEEVCSLENVLLVRSTRKPSFKEVTNELTSLVNYFDYDEDGILELYRVALFSGGLEDWFWQYDNKGLRLAQLRFYLLQQPD